MDTKRRSNPVNLKWRKRRHFRLHERAIGLMLKVRKNLSFSGGEARNRGLHAHRIIDGDFRATRRCRRRRKRTTER
jgi:hypothetical protein